MEIQPKDTSKGHFYVSLVKSFLRMGSAAAFICAGANPELMAPFLKVGGGLLGIAESLGILEELV
jgi:homospermidine synthase